MRGEGIVPVMEVGNNGNGGFGGYGNGDWAWIIVLFLIFGWGHGFGNGFGGLNGSGGIGENYVLASDFATLQRQLSDGFNGIARKQDATQEGLCDGFYAQNTNLLNGFSGVQQTLCQGFAGINQNIVTNGYETRNGLNTLGYNLQNCCCDLKTQLADCCCTTQRAIDGINYNMSTNTCAITNAINMSTRDIIDSQNANYRALHEELVANKLEAKNDRIAELTAQVNKLQLSASQERQNNYLISQLGQKCPEPAFIVPNPNCCYDYTVTRNTCCNNGIY